MGALVRYMALAFFSALTDRALLNDLQFARPVVPSDWELFALFTGLIQVVDLNTFVHRCLHFSAWKQIQQTCSTPHVLPSLRIVDISYVLCSCQVHKAFTPLFLSPTVQELGVSFEHEDNAVDLLESMDGMPNLTVLDLSFQGWSVWSLNPPSLPTALGHFPNLEVLALNGHKLDVALLDAIRRTAFPLCSVNLALCPCWL